MSDDEGTEEAKRRENAERIGAERLRAVTSGSSLLPATALPGQSRDRFGRPEKTKGNKRPAEFLPDDPNATTSDVQGNTDNAQTVNDTPVPTGQPMEEAPPASSLECGTRMQEFPSRNQLHRHLERWNHAIIDEHDHHPDLIESSDDEDGTQRRPKARRSRRDILNMRLQPMSMRHVWEVGLPH